VLDFTAGKPAKARAVDWLPQVRVNPDKAKLLDARVMANPETGGWRAFFQLDVPADTPQLELTCELHDGAEVISERWQYQWRR
jgi:glucans biosynthesis protein